MQRNRVLAALGKMLVVAVMITILAAVSLAQSTETVLHTFTYKHDGGFPFAGLTFDAKGNLYGVTYFAGDPDEGICCGGVFQLTPKSGGSWAFKVIHTFTIGNGEAPSGSVVFDAAGNLYGTTQEGLYCGNVYELSPTPKGEWKETVIHEFNDYKKGVLDDGCIPSSYLIFDQAGNLYGTTQQTGFGDCLTSAGCGTVFELSPAKDGKWTESVIHYFPDGSGDGSNPYGGLALDSSGNLWGTTLYGGAAGLGTVFELTPGAGGAWNESVAFNFTGNSTGYVPYAGLVIDKADNLYGTTFYGGPNDYGTVFELTPQPGGQLSETLLHQFASCTQTECPDGFQVFGGLVFDASGNLYGTTNWGGAAGTFCNTPPPVQQVGCGVVFKLTPGPQGTWDYSIVYAFPGAADGAFLTDDHLAVDSKGNIFGTTFDGGNPKPDICPQAVLGLSGCGVVFEITP